jgi:hypothetical protein
LLYGRGVPDRLRFHPRPALFLVGFALLVSRVAAAVSPAVAAPREAASPIARLFGVAPDSSVGTLTELGARAGSDCRAARPVTTGTPPREALPIVCTPAPAPAPIPMSATYWYEDGALARAFFLASEPVSTVAVELDRFDSLHAWIVHALGPPAQPLLLPRGWTGLPMLSDEMKRTALLSGAVRLSLTWQRPEGSVELWLAGERGAIVLAVGLRRNPAAPRCAPDVVSAALLDLFPPASDEARARAAELLAACRVTRAAGALRATLDHDEAPAVQLEALRALADLGAPPPRSELSRLSHEAPPAVAKAAKEILARPARSAPPAVAPPAPAIAAAPPARPAAPVAQAEEEEEPGTFGPPVPVPSEAPAASEHVTRLPPRAPAPRQPSSKSPFASAPPPAAAPAPSEPAEPTTGVPLAIGASTIAGATLFRNLGMTGSLTGVTPQLLLGSTGAVIGFGTSWGLSRFGFKPSVEQAAWFANTTAWGTLAGVGAWAATGYSDAPQLKYGLPVAGEVAGMAAGVWSARKWTWTGPQIVLADSLLLGAGLTSFGIGYISDPNARLTITDAIVAPVAMLGAAVGARYLDPSPRDVGLMTSGAMAAGWTGGLLGAGLSGSAFLDSHQSWGGVATGLGLGYLAGAAASPFVEVSPRTLGLGAAGMVVGNVLGLGLHLTIQGFSRDDVAGATFSPDEVHARATSAAVGGVLLASAGIAAAPHLQLRESAAPLAITGALYGAGTWALASAAGYSGRPVSDVSNARLEGGVLTGAALGSLGGLVASRWFAPDAEDQVTAALGAGLGLSAGLGIAKLTTDTKGTPDALGVLFGTGVGLAGGALAAHTLELRAPDVAAGALGLATGLFAGTLLPTIRWDTWQDSRVTAGGSLLGLSLGATTGIAVAHATNATGGEVGVATVAGGLGLLTGLGLGYALPCDGTPPVCTSQAPRVGALVGALSAMGGAIALEPTLHLSTTLGPDATKLAVLGGTFGVADGLLLAGALAPDGVISGASARQLWGGLLFGTSLESGAGLVASKWVRLNDGDRLFLAGGKLTGGLFGLGAAMLARDQTGGTDTLATLAGSWGGLAAATAAQMYTPLDGTDGASAAVGSAFGGFVGALVPTLDEPRWQGLDHRNTGGGLLLGLSAGAIAGAAVSHATNASPRSLGLATFGGLDGLVSGLGVGLLLSDEPSATNSSSRPTRIGLVAGTTAGLALGGIVWPRLEVSSGDDAMIGVATLLGGWTGVWLPTLGHASFNDISAQKPWGGLLAGVGLSSIGASLLAPAVEIEGDQLFDAATCYALFSAAGAGAGALVSTRDDAPVWGMLGAGTAGLVLGGALHRGIAFDADTGPFLAFAALEGGWLGGWIPELTDHPTDRERAGALALGGFGALGAATLATAAVRPDHDMLADAALVDALWTGAGAGAGALVSTSDKAPVWGLLGAGTAGLVLGGALHRQIELTSADAPLLLLAGGEGAWLGGWLPELFDSPTGRQRAGALALGAFGGLGLATVASPALHVDADLAVNAASLNALFAGAGAGAGALVSTSDKAPVWGLLGAGTAGLVLGGALHRQIELDQADAPLITLATAEGLWFGGWAPYVLHPSDKVTVRERLGGLALGGFGAAGVATAVSGALRLQPDVAGYGALGSAVGASLAGGISLLSPSLHDQTGAGIMLGGSAVGLASGLAIAPLLRDESTAQIAGAMAAGTGLGVSEALLFAWSGRANGSQEYAGAALVGGGVGATLGLAATAAPWREGGSAPATAGFAAWGAFSGSLAGSLVGLDPRNILFGGLIGTNVGLLSGYGLLHAGVVEPRDFGWLSLFGALGTVAGAGVAAPFSAGNSAPIRAGMAVGPPVGMVVGALVLPRLRRALTPSGSPTAELWSPTGGDAAAAESGDAETAAGTKASTMSARSSTSLALEGSSLSRKLSQVGSVTDWQPLVGALPASPDGGPAPVLFGLMGHWK